MTSNRRLFWLSFFVAAIAVLFGWSAVESAGDLRTCELAVGAVNRADAKVNIRRVTTNAFSRVIRVDYDLSLPDRKQVLSRFLVCRFASAKTPPFKSELTALATEFGPLPDANLYMLKRFYLNTDEARSATVPAVRVSSGGQAAGFVAHLAEWLLSVAAQASLLALLAFVFMVLTNLLRTLPPSMFYGLTGALAAGLGAWTTTGNISPFAPVLAVVAGVVTSGGMLALYAGDPKNGSRDLWLPWTLFSLFIVMGLSWFPGHGTFGSSWLPPALLIPLPLIAIAGYSLSASPLSLALILMAAVFTGLGFGLPKERKLTALPGFAVFVLLMALAGIFCAFGYLQFGLGANPLILATKAVLIYWSARGIFGIAQRLQILLTSLALVSIEYALAPFLMKPVIDCFGYALLLLLILVMGTARGTMRRETSGSS